MKEMLFFGLFLAVMNLNQAFSQNHGTGQDKKEIARDRSEIARDEAQKNRDDDQQKQFVVQTGQLKNALETHEMNRAYALQNGLLQSMAREIREMEAKVSQAKAELHRSKKEVKSESKDVRENRRDGQPGEAAADRADRRDDRRDREDDKADKNLRENQLARMRTIEADFRAYTFKVETVKEAIEKLALLDEFAEIMQRDVVATQKEVAEDRREKREDKKELRDDRREKKERN